MSADLLQPFRVLICHERFLFRFGADRVFLLIAARLKALGCHVTMLAARMDRPHVEPVADIIEQMPLPSAYRESDFFASRWFERVFAPRAKTAGGYDLIIHGGWPLFAATRTMRSLAPRVLFLDHGVVPPFGYPPFTQGVLAHLRELRRLHIRDCTHAAGVSRFIVETQTRPDAGDKVPVRVLLNGTDHLSPAPCADTAGPALQTVNTLLAAGHPLILNLGRVECGSYKNSQAAFETFQLIRSAIPRARLLVLETKENLRISEEHSTGVVPLGFPDDDELAAIIGKAALGLSTSLWEGFNLPLVELLRQGTPALALRIGAHVEVVPDDWFLAESPAHLAAKALTILEDDTVARTRLHSAEAKIHWDQLTWANFVTNMLSFLGLNHDARLRARP